MIPRLSVARSAVRARHCRCNQNQVLGSFRSSSLFSHLRQEDEEKSYSGLSTQKRHIHMTRKADFRATLPAESSAPFVLAFGVAGIAYGGKVAVEAYEKWEDNKKAEAAKAKENGEEPKAESNASWFSFGTPRFYEGGFESDMTKREAALILGVRESSPRKKVRAAHRKLAMLNHPDTGGSTFLATKINEAKEKLLGVE